MAVDGGTRTTRSGSTPRRAQAPRTHRDVPPSVTTVHGAPDFTANPDGPWARTPAEIRAELTAATERLAALQSAPAEERARSSTAEAFTAGVVAAARWTLALTPRRPMDGRSADVTDAEVVGQLTHARRVIDCDGTGWDLACGVLDWLQWLTGGLDRIVHPGG